MEKREHILKRMVDDGLVAVIRMAETQNLLQVVEALGRGGLSCIEITMTTPGALDIITELSRKLGQKVLIGAGTVLDADTARSAISAGAEFIVSPIFKGEIVEATHNYDKVCVPGAFTPTEILRAWEAGADVVKVFPATVLGPQFFKDIKGPLPRIRLTPTGGINLENASQFIEAGADFLGAGGSLLRKEAIRNEQWNQLTDLAAKFVAIIRSAREKIRAKRDQ
ncbi:MAG: bifunctional 4-hydroxy-2-oxoglutarate aldolase/2-dehydro-3-deoxy-phosphogluconate aldolase [Gemmatimonadota bacterium]|nr:MAG: bifunctional 4-hydroxy-2-oxoglutarate aldolase/2-dehydro-3-deoxy-phosphogluconate aldolase [Gemmatimonadota bacterium]